MVYLLQKTNKKGWIRIVEAFVAILLIAVVVLIVIRQDQTERKDTSSNVYTLMVSILRDIELNNSLRNEIVNILDSSLPVEWNEFNVSAPQTAARITGKTPGYLECVGKICATNDTCLLSQNQKLDAEIYAESVVISSTLQTYNPRLLKLFCWMK